MEDRPGGAATVLFADIEGNAQRWEKNWVLMRVEFSRQKASIRKAMAEYRGLVYKMIREMFQVAFDTDLEEFAVAVDPAQTGM